MWWRRLDLPSLEHFRLRDDGVSFRLEGRALLAADGEPAEVTYEVLCSPSRLTREARVQRGPGTRTVELRREEGGRWGVDGERRPDLDVYARTAPTAYRYESRGGTFTADLIVDEHGVVVSYGDLWERVGEA